MSGRAGPGFKIFGTGVQPYQSGLALWVLAAWARTKFSTLLTAIKHGLHLFLKLLRNEKTSLTLESC